MAASPLKALFDKRKMALTSARLKAWWDGKDFDVDAFEAALASAPAANDAGAAPLAGEADLFDPTPDPRLQALQWIWGANRLAPGESMMEELVASRLVTPATGILGLSGLGLSQPAIHAAEGHPGELLILEWRSETRAALTAGLKNAGLAARAKVMGFDLETGKVDADSLDGLLSIDDFTYCANPARLAVQFAAGLKPGCGALIEAYTGAAGADIAPAFASAFAEPQVLETARIGELLFEAGLRVEEEEDLTEPHIELARAGLQRVKSGLEGAGLDARALQELAWELETWTVRLRLLERRRLERRGWRVIRR